MKNRVVAVSKGGFKGGQGGTGSPQMCLLPTLVLDNIGKSLMKFLAVMQVKHLTEQLLCRLYLARPLNFFLD